MQPDNKTGGGVCGGRSPIGHARKARMGEPCEEPLAIPPVRLAGSTDRLSRRRVRGTRGCLCAHAIPPRRRASPPCMRLEPLPPGIDSLHPSAEKRQDKERERESEREREKGGCVAGRERGRQRVGGKRGKCVCERARSLVRASYKRERERGRQRGT